MKTKYLYLGSACGLLIIALLAILINAGVFKTITSVGDSQCQVIKGVVGAEDISFIPGSPLAFVSAYNRRIEVSNPNEKIQGGIYTYNIENQTLIKVSPDLDDFKPHGISVYQAEDGSIRLFVIDHAHRQQQVHIFNYIDGILKLERTVQSNQFISPNDLVAVGPEQFYVSNDHGFVSGILRLLEDYLMLPLSNVVFFDGEQAQEVASNISYANGINVNADGDRLYLASVTSLTLYVYERDINTHQLTLIDKINTGTGIDNIEIDEQGDLWLGAHPQLLKFVSHAKDIKKRSPSEIIKVKSSDDSYAIETIYRSAGDPISGSSVAAVKGNRMLIGSVFDPLFLDCEL